MERSSTLVAVEVSREEEFTIGACTRLFQRNGLESDDASPNYASPQMASGSCRGANQAGREAADSSIRVIVNWPAKFAPGQQDHQIRICAAADVAGP